MHGGLLNLGECEERYASVCEELKKINVGELEKPALAKDDEEDAEGMEQDETQETPKPNKKRADPE